MWFVYSTVEVKTQQLYSWEGKRESTCCTIKAQNQSTTAAVETETGLSMAL